MFLEYWLSAGGVSGDEGEVRCLLIDSPAGTPMRSP